MEKFEQLPYRFCINGFITPVQGEGNWIYREGERVHYKGAYYKVESTEIDYLSGDSRLPFVKVNLTFLKEIGDMHK